MRTDKPRLLLAGLLAVGAAVLVLDDQGVADPVTGAAREVGSFAFTPVSAGVSAAATPLHSTYDALRNASGANDRISELEEENADLRQRVRSAEYDEERADQLADLLHLSDLGGYEVVPAHAVTRISPQGSAESIVLDVGTEDGVGEDMTVVHADGLVGRVTNATARRATVLMLNDASSAVGSRMEDSSEAGVVRGQARSLSGDSLLRLELLDSTSTVDPGDRVVTLGSHDNAPFVPGVPIGTVENIAEDEGEMTQAAEVRPAVDLSQIDVVGVVVAGPDGDPGDDLLPDDAEKDSDEEAQP
ncbi:rod shape-determining protein MreC [Spiractinospora alimapuensis]|uniref:rod shape-determining protein MreC n=1 Tax=Spiractinospora alimapuensis TaxID=2820884 RepID=UPI001F2559AE|nr:rod shape-determining protein MreC [Spiractinospora alimapuensis]QVQ51930.1 rod shape-determining protein MreC [Spiractinospora alimapuensis]